MTVFLPLEADSPFPQSPSFLSAAPDPAAHVTKVVKAILKAKRIAVVCGAGISVQAGIPDFRSSDGLFQNIKRENPRESLTSGKDLFDASVFNSEHTTALFCQMIAGLSSLSSAASPTPFHHLLRTLDERGKLLRVYTQNIDALELKAGLTFGVPEFDDRRTKPKSKTSNGRVPDEVSADGRDFLLAPPSDPGPSRLPTPPAETPRCIPLHGTLQQMHCQTCTHSFPLPDHLPALAAGVPPDCPECAALEATRQLVGKRLRGVGKLRPSVVLYNEEHRHGEGVGEVARKDLVGGAKGRGRAGADLLLVVGTSLRVPGTKRIVREFSKAVRSRAGGASTTPATSKLPSPSPSPRRSPAGEEEAPIKTIYLNFDFPVPTREWDGVFDVWIQGDVQTFAERLRAELDSEDKAREAALEKRRRKEEEAALEKRRREEEEAAREAQDALDALLESPKKMKVVRGKKSTSKGALSKRKAEGLLAEGCPVKKRRVNLIVRPPATPPPTPKRKYTRKNASMVTSSPKSPSVAKGRRSPTKTKTPLKSDIPPLSPLHKSHARPPMARKLSIAEVVITVPPPGWRKSKGAADTPLCPLSADVQSLLHTPPSRRKGTHVPGPPSPRCRKASSAFPPLAVQRKRVGTVAVNATPVHVSAQRAGASMRLGRETGEEDDDLGMRTGNPEEALVRRLQQGLRS